MHWLSSRRLIQPKKVPTTFLHTESSASHLSHTHTHTTTATTTLLAISLSHARFVYNTRELKYRPSTVAQNIEIEDKKVGTL